MTDSSSGSRERVLRGLAVLVTGFALAACTGGGSGGGGSAATAPAGSTGGSTTGGGGQPGTPGGGGSTTGGGTAPANVFAVLPITPAWVESGHVELDYTLVDPGAQPATLAAEFSLDGGQTWANASEGIGSDGLSGLASLPSPGAAHRFVWDSFLDLGEAQAPGVRVRLAVSSASGQIAAETADFALNNGHAGPQITLRRGPYLQLPQGGEVTVKWQTHGATVASLEWGPTPQLGQSRQGVLHSDHEMVITGLAPGQRYFYRVLANGQPLCPPTPFRAAAGPSDTRFAFLALGDSGKGSQGQWDVAQGMDLADADFAVHVGDIVYSDGEQALYDPRFFSPYRKVLARAPMFAAMGNHDVKSQFGQAYLDNFVNPAQSGSEKYYTFHYGHAQFFFLDTSYPWLLTPGLPQLTWFIDELTRSTATWKIAVFHHPPYSAGGHGSDTFTKLFLAPQLEGTGVDLVLNGHDHHYERTHRQRDTTYVVTGAGGASSSTLRAPRSWTANMAIGFQFMHIEIDGNRLHAEARLPDGSVLDSFDIVK